VTTPVGYLDERTAAYVDDVLAAIARHVPLVEAYLVGSAVTGNFDPATSDVDVVAVVEGPLHDERQRVIEAVAGVACPVRDLELAMYVQGQDPPDVELNLNHGEEADAEAFWFVLDAARAQEHALPLLHGRAWTDVFEPLSDDRIREAALASLEWSERKDGEFARMNAVRTRYYLEHGEWITKAEASQ